MAMGKRIATLFELLIALTLFALFAGMVITTHSNNAIISHTEEFVEMTRYKGCITEETYKAFLDSFDSVVDVRIQVDRKDVLGGPDALDSTEFTQDVVNTIASDPDGIYRMKVGDEITVIVRRPAGNLYDTIIGSLSGMKAQGGSPVIAIKGGMILNEQYVGA